MHSLLVTFTALALLAGACSNGQGDPPVRSDATAEEPESEASFFAPAPMLVQYYAGERTGLGYVATYPPDAWMRRDDWTLVPRPFSSYPINRGMLRADRGSRNVMERLGEFGMSLLHGKSRQLRSHVSNAFQTEQILMRSGWALVKHAA